MGEHKLKRCSVCNKTFRPKMNAQTMCSSACRKIRRKEQDKYRNEYAKANRVKRRSYYQQKPQPEKVERKPAAIFSNPWPLRMHRNGEC